MANEIPITVVGNLTADPELRHTDAGVAVANFTIASTPRIFDRETNAWKDGEPVFLRSSLWREYAENFAASATKGQSVIATGTLKQRSYEVEGQKRTVIELEVTDIGPTNRFGTTVYTRAVKGATAPAAAVAAPARAAAPAAAAPVENDDF
jgi:single-strand DNA-binding protein